MKAALKTVLARVDPKAVLIQEDVENNSPLIPGVDFGVDCGTVWTKTYLDEKGELVTEQIPVEETQIRAENQTLRRLSDQLAALAHHRHPFEPVLRATRPPELKETIDKSLKLGQKRHGAAGQYFAAKRLAAAKKDR